MDGGVPKPDPLAREGKRHKSATTAYNGDHAMAKGQQLLHQGIVLARSREKPQARRILGQVVKQNPRSIMGWLWLASVVETREQQHYCLERVLQLEPDNKVARQMISQVKPEQSPATVKGQYFLGHQVQ